MIGVHVRLAYELMQQKVPQQQNTTRLKGRRFAVLQFNLKQASPRPHLSELRHLTVLCGYPL